MANTKTRDYESKQVVLNTVFEDVMHNSMIPYSENVILDRAIPRVEDGLKPVQRRVLYSMHEMGLTPDKPHKKCARIVGDCLGKYHPHGDSSVYGALVRMAQPFSMRMVLVDGHGNFGSVDGDGAAAMRYTEARMSKLALELLRDIDKETVVWTPNFDDSLEEPNTLPGRFPNLLVNGANGIAVGLATNIPTHNMGECIDAVIAKIDDPDITTAQLLKVFHGPDFPTGGYIIPIDSLENIYETGKGRIKIRSRLHMESDDGGRKNIVITEIPYQVSKTELLTRIADLKESNKELLAGIAEIVDESDKTGMRAVIKCKRDADVNKIVDFLFKKSNLEMGYSINMVAIANGKPEQLSLKAYLGYYVEYQRQIIVRRTGFDLKAARARAEIVEGLLIAIRNIDEVIKIIRESESTAKAKERLMQRFGLSDVQAQAILDMRLKTLAKLEVGKLEEELRELRERIANYEAILASKRKQLDIVKKELLQIKKELDSPRLTVILDKEEDEKNFTVPDVSEAIEYRDGVLALSQDGQLRFMSQKSYIAGTKDVTALAKDAIPLQAIDVNNKGSLLAITNMGSLVKIDVTTLPERKFREKAIKLGSVNQDVQSGEYPIKLIFFEGMPTGELLLFTRKGVVKRVNFTEFASGKTYFRAMSLAEKDSVIGADVVDPDKFVLEVTADGQVLTFKTDEIPVQGRNAAGVKGVKLNEGDSVVYASQADDEGEIIVITDKLYAKRVIVSTIDLAARYQKGIKLVELDGSKVKYVGLVKMPYDIIVGVGDEIRLLSTEAIKIETRTTKGKPIEKNRTFTFAAPNVKGAPDRGE